MSVRSYEKRIRSVLALEVALYHKRQELNPGGKRLADERAAAPQPRHSPPAEGGSELDADFFLF